MSGLRRDVMTLHWWRVLVVPEAEDKNADESCGNALMRTAQPSQLLRLCASAFLNPFLA